MEQESYRLPELADAAGVTPRTVRYYIAQGLLPSPGRLGAGTRYGSEHLDRLRLIRGLQDEGLSLSEIRDRLGAPPTRMLADPGWAPLEPRLALLRAPRAERRAPAAPPLGHSTWERIALAPDLELHVRRPHADATRRMVHEIRSLIDRRLG